MLPALAGAQEKPLAAVGRVSVIGEIGEAEKQIIGNRLSGQLSLRYDLISPQEYQQAEDEAFATLEAEQCTEENCVRKIQEFLQVERVFILQIVREANLTQLSLTLFKGDSRRVAEDSCTDCAIADLYPRVDALVAQIVKGDLETDAQAGQPGSSVPVEQTPSKPSWSLWTGVGLLAGAGLAQYYALETNDQAKGKAQDARTQNDAILASDAKSDRSEAETLQTAAVVIGTAGVAFLVYYWFFEEPGDSGVTADAKQSMGSGLPVVQLTMVPNGPSVAATWRW
jgi:hypothetical protein